MDVDVEMEPEEAPELPADNWEEMKAAMAVDEPATMVAPKGDLPTNPDGSLSVFWYDCHEEY